MPAYDPRELAVRLEISRNYNVEMVKRYEKLKIEYERLLEKYHELVRAFVSTG